MQEKNVLELRIPAECISEDHFVCLIQSLSAIGSCEQQDANDGKALRISWFMAGKDPKLTRARIAAGAMLAGIPSGRISINSVNEDWETAWQRDWQAMEVGKRLRVRPAFCPAVRDERIDIVLDPGMAFGTGQHATTQLCLESIERICREPMPSSMLDMGSGSGLLAIAAAKLGVKQVLAIDHDPIAVEACKVNAAINGVVLRSVLDDTPPNARFSLIVANILAGPLIAMAPRLAACAGGPLVLSGLLAAQVNDVGRAYMRAGLTPVRTDVRDEWAALELKSGAP